MSKYDPLRTYLCGVTTSETPLSFADIERIIGGSLPPAAYNHRAWWSNNPSNSVITHAWLNAGFKTERVDMAARRLVFRRTGPAPRGGAPAPTSPTAGGLPSIVARLQSALGGTVRIAEGVDLTAPAAGAWDADR